MIAEIIAVGSEMLTPFRTDTNSLFLTEGLNDLGVSVAFKTVIGDNREHLTSAVRIALSRADIVITSGGLGPTEDARRDGHHHAAVLLSDEMRPRLLGDVEGSDDVHLKLPPERIESQRREVRDGQDAGVVDHDVNAAVVVDRRGHHGLGVGLLRHIAGVGYRFAAASETGPPIELPTRITRLRPSSFTTVSTSAARAAIDEVVRSVFDSPLPA